MTRESSSHPGPRDLAALLVCVALLYAECLWLSHGREYWSDELFGLVLARDPSLSHMLFAWRHGADGGGIFFYLIARAWLGLFGASATAFRLLNATGMAAGMALCWVTLRRRYRLEIVAFSVPFCWFTAHSVLQQLAIARPYGLLVAATALCLFCFARLDDQRAPTSRALWAVFLGHALLVGLHPFGVVYSAVLLAGVVLTDALRRELRPKLYASAAAGWSVLVASGPALAAATAVGKPHFWTTRPAVRDLRDAFSFWTDELQWFGLFLLVCLALRQARSLPRARERGATDLAPAEKRGERDLMVLGLALFCTIPLVYAVSQRGTSIFVDRYLTPVIAGGAVLLCAALHRLVPERRPRWATAAVAGAALILTASSAWSATWDLPHFFTVPPHEYTGALAQALPPGLPVVVERVDIFAEAVHAQPSLDVHYLLDWEVATDPGSPRGDVSGFHEMQNWANAGYFRDRIEASADFLARERDFVVVADEHELWFRRRILADPRFRVERIGSAKRERDVETLWRVRRLGADGPGAGVAASSSAPQIHARVP